ncbi:MAG: NUDIX hydrolase [Gallionella sp.]
MIWKPNVTVAAVIEQEGRFLLVEEETSQGLRFNQPAGHWEKNETLSVATRREALEESAYDFEPQYMIGIYRWHSSLSDTTFLRFAFGGKLLAHHPERSLDQGILRTAWLTLDDIRANQAHHRSPLVLRCCEDYLAGKRYPLDILVHYE